MQVVEETACSQSGGLIVVCVFVPSGDHVLERTVDHVTSPSSPPHLPLPPPSPLPWPIISPFTSSLTYLLPSLPSSPPSALRYQVRRHYVFFERNSSFSRMTLCDYWKVIPQFVPLNGLHSDICVLRTDPVRAECPYSFVQWQFAWDKIKMSITSTFVVTSAYIECQMESDITQ